ARLGRRVAGETAQTLLMALGHELGSHPQGVQSRARRPLEYAGGAGAQRRVDDHDLHGPVPKTKSVWMRPQWQAPIKPDGKTLVSCETDLLAPSSRGGGKR